MTEHYGFTIGENNLPYPVPIHPQFVHLTLGLLIIAVLFDIAGALFPLERSLFKLFGLTAIRSSFFTVGWYNLVAATVITFFTVVSGFFELALAMPPPPGSSTWGLSAATTMFIHGIAGILILAAIVGMTLWRGLQRYRWRKNARREVQWSYLLVGIVLFGILFIHGTLGAQLGDQFGVHNTAANLVRQGQNPNIVLKSSAIF